MSSYSRAEAIEDGTLIDISTTALQAGIKFPVAITRAAWGECVELPEGYRGAQSERGRLWDVVWMLRCGIARWMIRSCDNTFSYRLHVRSVKRSGGDTWVDAGGERTPPLVTLKAMRGPGDQREPVITVMLAASYLTRALGALLLCATLAYGADSQARGGKRWWVASAAALVVAHALDVHSSYGAYEANPMLRGADGRFRVRGVGIKFGIAAGSLIVQRVILRRHEAATKPFAVVNFIGAGAVAGAAVRNWKVSQ